MGPCRIFGAAMLTQRLGECFTHAGILPPAAAVGFRPNRPQILKVGSDIQGGRDTCWPLANYLEIQLVAVTRPISVARN